MHHFTTNLLGRIIHITEPALKGKTATLVAIWSEKDHDLHFLAALDDTGELKTLVQQSFVLSKLRAL